MRPLVRIVVAVPIVALLSIALLALVLVIVAASISRVAGIMLSQPRPDSAPLAPISLGRRPRALIPQAETHTFRCARAVGRTFRTRAGRSSGVPPMISHAGSRGTELSNVNEHELIQIAHWHFVRWSSGQSRFDRRRAQRRTRMRESGPSSVRIAELGATENSDGAGLSSYSPASSSYPSWTSDIETLEERSDAEK